MIADGAQKSLAYNLGSDARMAGLGTWACPGRDPELRRMWLLGWQDMDQNWGSKGKWPCRKLPDVLPEHKYAKNISDLIGTNMAV